MKYEIDIENDQNELEEYEKSGKNVLEVVVYDKTGKMINDSLTVGLSLSQDALLGLGTELIRLAHKYKEGRHYHLDPAEKEMIVQRLGVFSAPNSQELIICCADMKTIDEYFR